MPRSRSGGAVSPKEHLADAEPEDERDDVRRLERPARISVALVNQRKNGRRTART